MRTIPFPIYLLIVFMFVFVFVYELYHVKTELWLTIPDRTFSLPDGKYSLLMVPLSPAGCYGRCASCFKRNYLGAEWALLPEKVPFSISIFATKVQLNGLALQAEDLASK